MKVLIIGGKKFLGRHLINAAQSRNHEVTIFNRGKFSEEVFLNVEQINGDRNRDLMKLSNRTWDAVIDTCGYLPQSVRLSAEFFKHNVDRYIFISSISAYADFSEPNFDETAPLSQLTYEQEAELSIIDIKGDLTAYALGEMYGALKVLCEQEIERTMPNRTLIIRPGLIVGEFDWTDRFSYWVMRVARGGEVLAPANPKRFIQFIDAMDLAEWTIKMAEDKWTGIFNAVGRPFELTMEALLSEIRNVTHSNAEFTWASEKFLTDQAVEPWTDMPLFIPESDESMQGFLSANVDKAIEKGLSFRPLRETILRTLNWRSSVADKLNAGISEEREAELLTRWKLRG